MLNQSRDVVSFPRDVPGSILLVVSLFFGSDRLFLCGKGVEVGCVSFKGKCGLADD